MKDPNKVLLFFVKLLKQRGISHCVVGGVAANSFAPKDLFRETKDIDFAVGRISKTAAEKIRKEAKEEFGEIRLIPLASLHDGDDPPPNASESHIMNPVMYGLRGDEIKVDLLLPENPWIESALAHAVEQKLFQESVAIIAREELVAAKIISFADRASRRKDLQDLRHLTAAPLNHSRIECILEMTRPIWREEFAQVLPPVLQQIVKRYAAK